MTRVGSGGRSGSSSVMVVWMVATMVAVGSRWVVEAEGPPSCADKLVPCGSYLNNATTATPPSEECCRPMREAVANDLTCLCAILNDPSVTKAFNIHPDKAFQLARACRITNLNGCSPAPSATPAPPGNKGAAYKANWIGLSSLMSLFLFWWFIVT